MNDIPLPSHLFRGLGDKLYDKRKQAALEIEKYVLSFFTLFHNTYTSKDLLKKPT